jgi:hypothetical protein
MVFYQLVFGRSIRKFPWHILIKIVVLTFFNFLYSIVQIITQLLEMQNNKPKK